MRRIFLKAYQNTCFVMKMSEKSKCKAKEELLRKHSRSYVGDGFYQTTKQLLFAAICTRKRFLKITLMALSLIICHAATAQENLMDDKHVVPLIKDGIAHTYNMEFREAALYYDKVAAAYPGHAVNDFFNAQIIYWKNFPLILDNPESEFFIEQMNKCIQKADEALEDNPDNPEKIFISLVSKAFLMMFYADNEEYLKVMRLARNAYPLLKKSFSLRGYMVDFYFVTGLYNYYIEAYPEAHPAYKPITFFFKNGNKKQGLKQLIYASQYGVFLKAEALFFLQHIYMYYEQDPDAAQDYSEKLINLYPGNLQYLSNYLEVLILRKKYDKAIPIINQLIDRDEDDYFKMKALIFNGYYNERVLDNHETAKINYYLGVRLAEKMGYPAEKYLAYGLMGLSNIYDKEGNKSKARDYEKLAKSYLKYGYLDEIREE